MRKLRKAGCQARASLTEVVADHLSQQTSRDVLGWGTGKDGTIRCEYIQRYRVQERTVSGQMKSFREDWAGTRRKQRIETVSMAKPLSADQRRQAAS